MSSSPHRPLALVAGGMLAFAAILVGLRDSFLVPLLTGQLGYSMVLDHFWTPAVNWLAVGSMGGGIVCGALAALTWRQARVGGRVCLGSPWWRSLEASRWWAPSSVCSRRCRPDLSDSGRPSPTTMSIGVGERHEASERHEGVEDGFDVGGLRPLEVRGDLARRERCVAG